MQIKRFEAKDMTAALAVIKQEFGPDAVILSAKSIRSYGVLGGAKTKGVEVTAAIDPSSMGRAVSPAQPPASGDDVVTLSMGAARRRTSGRIMSSINNGIAGLKGRAGRAAAEETPPAAPRDDSRFRRHLDGQGVNRILTDKCLRRMGSASAHPAAALANALELEGIRTRAPQQTSAAPAVMVFVGPSGVGKTTTVIKLATRMAVDEGLTVGLLTLDHQRIGAVEQMQLYADILQVPMAPVFDPKSLKHALSALSGCEVVLVDTPGIAPGDVKSLASLQQLLKGARHAEVHLVMSVGTKEEDLDRIMNGFQPLAVGALVFTKFDESVSCGNVLNVLHRSRMPLAFVSDGSEIPEDLHDGTMVWLARRLVADYTPGTTEAHPMTVTPADGQRRQDVPRSARAIDNAGQPFVANSNSDIFHRTDCKWTKMIKSENFISFDSMEDALSQGFNPCRYCKPRPLASGTRMPPPARVGNLA
ncbi:MAG: flagellar biosynthesis protein FlhF [Pseudomonadota bacterium]